MIKIGVIRNLALLGFSIVGEQDERVLIYDVFDMDSPATFCMTESADAFKPTGFLDTVALMNGKGLSDDITDYDDYLPLPFSVATIEGEITEPNNLIVMASPTDIDSEKVDKCMDYLNCLKK